MADREQGWRWFETADAASDSERASKIEKSYARCFGGPDGDSVLAHLRAMTIERALGPEAGDTALRHLEGQRHLVVHIGAMIARGRDPLA